MAIPETMKAWQRQPGSKVPVPTQCPVPKATGDSMLLKVLAAGVCHSDSTILNLPGMPPGWHETFIMGHEGCGEVVALGPEVDQSKFKIGDKVAILPTSGCKQSTCGECSRGLERICQRAETYGLGHDGVFAEYVRIKQHAAALVPQGVPAPEASVAADAVLTAYHAIKNTAAVKPDQTIVIFGLGGVGMNALQTALHLGVKRVLVVDQRQEPIDEAIRLGVPKDDAINSTTGKVEAKVAAEGIVVDTTIDFVGTQDTFTSAQYSIRPGGKLVQVGLIGDALTFGNVPTIMRELDIKTSYNGTIEGLRECLDLMSKGILHPRVETTTMDHVTQVIQDLDDGKVKCRMILLPN